MPEIVERLQAFVEDKPWVAVGAVVVGAAGVAFALSRRDGKEPVDESGQPVTRNPLYDLAPGQLPVLINQPTIGEPPEQTVPDQSLISIIRDGRILDVTAGPPGLCPPGYVSAQQPGQPPRCTLVNPANKERGQRQVFFPSRGEGPFVT